MILNIEKGGLIKETQGKFNLVYPYLKIEFFKTPAYPETGSKSIAEKNNGSEAVSSRESFSKSVEIDIGGKRIVSELEEDFKKMLGLSVRLFRKSGNMWIQTTLTNNWSLKKQNEEGEFLSCTVIQKNLLEADPGDSWMEPE